MPNPPIKTDLDRDPRAHLRAQLHGALLVDKPVGPSSADCVNQIKKALRQHTGERIKTGHGGTLDPFASGLLVLLLGEATRLAQFFLGGQKRYRARVHFGTQTSTGDHTGPVVDTLPIPTLNSQTITAAAQNFLLPNVYWQTPPMFSALHHQGERLYDLARRGVVVERPARACHLSHFCWLEGSLSDHLFEVTCSAGTYIRVFAEDLARALNTCGHLTALRRTEASSLLVQNALELPQALGPPSDWGSAFIPLSQMHPFLAQEKGFQVLELTEEQIQALKRGQQDWLHVWIEKHLDRSPGIQRLALVSQKPQRLAAIATCEPPASGPDQKISVPHWRTACVFHS